MVLRVGSMLVVSRLQMSRNAGASWRGVSGGPKVNSVDAVAVNPQSPSTVYIGTGGAGIYMSTDGGSSWEAANQGLDYNYVQDIEIDPADPSILYAATSNDFGDGGGV